EVPYRETGHRGDLDRVGLDHLAEAACWRFWHDAIVNGALEAHDVAGLDRSRDQESGLNALSEGAPEAHAQREPIARLEPNRIYEVGGPLASKAECAGGEGV